MRIEMSPACVFAVLPGSSSCPCFAAALQGCLRLSKGIVFHDALTSAGPAVSNPDG